MARISWSTASANVNRMKHHLAGLARTLELESEFAIRVVSKIKKASETSEVRPFALNRPVQ